MNGKTKDKKTPAAGISRGNILTGNPKVKKFAPLENDGVVGGTGPLGWVTGGGVKAAAGGAKGVLGFVKNVISKTKEIPYIPKKLPHEGLISPEKLTSVINRSKSKGVIYDKNIGAGSDFTWKSNMFRKMPDVGGRKMVDVNPGGGIPSQRFYQSLGKGNKGVDKFGNSLKKPGHWVPLEAFGTIPKTKKWFIKDKGWDQGYGSETFKNMGKVIKKMGY